VAVAHYGDSPASTADARAQQVESPCYAFGDLILDTATRRVTRNGRPIELHALTFDLLRVLVEAAPEIVTFDDLAERVWQRSFVSPTAIAQRVRLLRRSLSEDARTAQYLESVRARGYRLKADVVDISNRPARSTIDSSAERSDHPAACDWYSRAVEAFLVQSPRQGFEFLGRALSIDPQFAAALGLKAVALARALINGDDNAPRSVEESSTLEEQALDAAAEALRLDAGTSLAWIARAMIHTGHWRWREARVAYDTAFSIAAGDTTALEPYACFNIFIGDVGAALKAAQAITAIDPRNAMGRWLEGRALSTAGRYEEALLAYGDALNMSPIQILLQRSVGDANVLLDRRRDAERSYRAAEQLLTGHPSLGVWMPSLAYGYGRLGLQDDADRLARSYETWAQTCRPGVGDRALVFLARRDDDAALELLGTAAEIVRRGDFDPGLWALIELQQNYLNDPLLEQPVFRKARARLRPTQT
jgi:DNA-binding winged helix-turn-helix (wHTH) protein